MKALIIAGNGPSLKSINYELIPEDFDVFRANQFYSERKYYLGKKIKGAFFNIHLLNPQTYTFYKLKELGEYEIDQMYCSYPFPLANTKTPNILAMFPEVKIVHDYIIKFPKLYQLNCYHERYFAKHFTTGIGMLITGMAQGYKEIHLTGIDFYEGHEKYAFNHGKNINHYLPYIDETWYQDTGHDKEIELQALSLCYKYQKEQGGEIYSLSSNNTLNKIFPPSPLRKTSIPQYFKEDKKNATIFDIILPIQTSNDNLVNSKYQYHSPSNLKNKKSLLFRFIAFLLRIFIMPLLPFLKRWYFKMIKYHK